MGVYLIVAVFVIVLIGSLIWGGISLLRHAPSKADVCLGVSYFCVAAFCVYCALTVIEEDKKIKNNVKTPGINRDEKIVRIEHAVVVPEYTGEKCLEFHQGVISRDKLNEYVQEYMDNKTRTGDTVKVAFGKDSNIRDISVIKPTVARVNPNVLQTLGVMQQKQH